MMSTLATSGIATHANAQYLTDRVCDNLSEHISVARLADHARLETLIGSVALIPAGQTLSIEIHDAKLCDLFAIRNMIAEHLFLAAGDLPLSLVWSDGPQPLKVPDFHEAVVVDSSNITPHMRRVTLSVDDINAFMNGGLHVRLLIPPQNTKPVWPHAEPDGRISWPRGDDTLVVRAYTIRAIDVARKQLAIDFVIHEGDEVPGASWAVNARQGERVGLLGPGGGGVPEASHIFLAGDETAIPAIARIAEQAPIDMDVNILLEVDSVVDEQPIPCAANCTIRWIHRQGCAAGTSKALENGVKDMVRTSAARPYVWVACEQSAARSIREFMRRESGYDRSGFCVAAYWQRR